MKRLRQSKNGKELFEHQENSKVSETDKKTNEVKPELLNFVIEIQ